MGIPRSSSFVFQLFCVSSSSPAKQQKAAGSYFLSRALSPSLLCLDRVAWIASKRKRNKKFNWPTCTWTPTQRRNFVFRFESRRTIEPLRSFRAAPPCHPNKTWGGARGSDTNQSLSLCCLDVAGHRKVASTTGDLRIISGDSPADGRCCCCKFTISTMGD